MEIELGRKQRASQLSYHRSRNITNIIKKDTFLPRVLISVNILGSQVIVSQVVQQ